VTPQELSDRIAAVMVEVATWMVDPSEWGRDDLDTAIEVWNRLDRLMIDLAVLRRDHARVLARRVDNEQTVITRDGSVTIHRDVPRNEKWDGHRVLGELAAPLIDADTGEVVEAVDVEVLRRVIPACVQGQTSSRWKITELRKEMQNPEHLRSVEYGDAVIARGPMPGQVKHARPPKDPPVIVDNHS